MVTSDAVYDYIFNYSLMSFKVSGNGTISTVNLNDQISNDGIYLMAVSFLYDAWSNFYLATVFKYGNNYRVVPLQQVDVTASLNGSVLSFSSHFSVIKFMQVGYW